MEYSYTFSSYLYGLRKIVARDRYSSSDDKQALVIDIRNHPPPTHNSRGDHQWNLSEAQILLGDDIEAGNHLRIQPKELH